MTEKAIAYTLILKSIMTAFLKSVRMDFLEEEVEEEDGRASTSSVVSIGATV